MKRREFFGLLGGAVATWPRGARSQQLAMPVIGCLHSGSPSSFSNAINTFRHGLREAGFAEGQNLIIDFRWGDDRFERLPAMADELVRNNVQLIAAFGGDVSVLAAKNATAEIPVVFAIGADPVRRGIVASLNRPGGNITGATFLSVELRPKTLELIRELKPNAEVIAVLGNPNRPDFDVLLNEVLRPARSMGLKVHVLKASSEKEIEVAFATLKHLRADFLLALSDPVYMNHRHKLAALAAEQTVPTVHTVREYVIAGAMMSYGASYNDAYRQAGVYAGRILKGEKPADLPVQQPTKFELAINLKTAKALGLAVPPTLLARADEVIE